MHHSIHTGCTAVAAVALAALVAGGTASTASATGPAGHLLVGARSNDISFTAMTAELGPVRVTREFYGTLPATFSQGDVPAGVKLIVSYKTPSSNTTSYVRSIPAGVDVEMAFHHEPEGPRDYPGDPEVEGPRFTAIFNAQAAIIRAANPRVRVAFIGGAYQYGNTSGGNRGIGGYFIPSGANDYYEDSYQRSVLLPAAQDEHVQNFIAALTAKGHTFNGFTEYGRGVIAAGATFDQAVATDRVSVIKADAAYLKTLPGVDVWAYWYTTDKASTDQWRFSDSASTTAWKAVEDANS